MLIIPVSILMITDSDDRTFMEKLYLKYRYLLFQVALRIVQDPQTAEDMVSETIVSLIDHIETLRKLNDCKVMAYIVSTVRNTSFDYIRKQNRQFGKNFLTGEECDFHFPDEQQVDDDLIRHAEISAIRQALKKLPESDREVLRMKYFNLMADAEIAQNLHIQNNSVRYYLTKARRHLRRILEKDELI